MQQEASETARGARPWSKRAPTDRPWDVLVIGSGMGGMTTAGLLARTGRRVLVLEQHYVPGGFTHVFRREGYRWDVGVHIVGNTALHALPGRVMDLLSAGNLKWQPVGDVYDQFFYPDGFSVAFPSDPDTFAAVLLRAFPRAGDQIDRYFAALKATARSLQGWHLSHLVPGAVGRWVSTALSGGPQGPMHVTAAEKLEELIQDDKLRAVLTGQWGYHGIPPSKVSWALHAMVSWHFLHGASYPVGGASRIASTFLQGVADAGGWTRVCADVAQILIEGGRAVGVRMADGEEIRAPSVVSAAGAWTTVTKLLPPEVGRAGWAERIAALEPSPAHVCLYIGFKGDISAAGADRSCQWFFDSWSHEHGTWRVRPGEALSRPPILFCSFPSLKDPEHTPGVEGRQTGELIAFVPWAAFEAWKDQRCRSRGPAYEAFKAEIAAKMMEVLFEHHPGLRPLVDCWELSTPLSTDHFARAQQGAIYGLAGTPARHDNPWLRPKSPIPGLSGSPANA